MATNQELIKLHAQRKDLVAQQRELLATIRRAERKLTKVEAKLEAARSVTRVLNGIAIAVDDYRRGNSMQMRTLASGEGIKPRVVHLYQRADSNCWAARVYESDNGRERFLGGRALGLGQAWTRKQAKEIAERWLKGDDSVLE